MRSPLFEARARLSVTCRNQEATPVPRELLNPSRSGQHPHCSSFEHNSALVKNRPTVANPQWRVGLAFSLVSSKIATFVAGKIELQAFRGAEVFAALF